MKMKMKNVRRISFLGCSTLSDVDCSVESFEEDDLKNWAIPDGFAKFEGTLPSAKTSAEEGG